MKNYKKDAEDIVNEIKDKTEISIFEAIECAKLLCEKIILVLDEFENLNTYKKGCEYWFEINKELYKMK